MKFYRIYHVEAHGEIAGVLNFRAADDVQACERGFAIAAEKKWPGIELWEGMRRVHCEGVARLAAGVPDFSPRKIGVVTQS